MAKYKLPHSGHNRHLCYLVNLGCQQRSQKMYEKLVCEPKYFCLQCGRAAGKAKNLCKPFKMESNK
ncbi:MAG: hypothetical protein ACYSSP_05560 [Planctomycetota bacterium]|jgi:hypothetical protein